jgi:hypothetical protein
VALAVAQTNYGEVVKPETFYALATLYFAAKGSTWRFDTNWLQGASPCDDSWFGVECYSDGSIRSIKLPGNNLKGSLPSQIGMLSNLETLSLGLSHLSGSVPSEIGMLSELWHLSIFNSFVYGNIPTEIGNCRRLKVLDIGSTMLTGTIPSEIGTLNRLSKCLTSAIVEQLSKTTVANLTSIVATMPRHSWTTFGIQQRNHGHTTN